VGKQSDSRYEPGRRSHRWVKVKAWNTQDCVIAGWTEGRGARGSLGALVLGVYDGDKLVHAGQAGSGLDGATIRTLLDLLTPLRTDKCPLATVPHTDQPATWVKPELVCEVRFTEWTTAGTMRHPTFLRLRPEVSPRDCVREQPLDPSEVLGNDDKNTAPRKRATATATARRTERTRRTTTKPTPTNAPATAATTPPAQQPSQDIPDCVPWNGPSAEIVESLERLARARSTDTVEIAGRQLKLTNLDKVFWPDEGYTKRDLIAHYVRFGEVILPYLYDRPLSTDVYPDGITGPHFWRKDKPKHAPEWIVSWRYEGEDASKDWIVPREIATLAWVANAGAIDIHPWHSRCDAPYQPDWAVFDLDPFEPATFRDICDVAKLVKAALDHYGLRGHAKVSGQTGLQIYVPIRRGPTYETVRGWVESVGRAIGRVVPDRITWDWSVSKRTGKIRIDYTQNILNKTLAAPYALRPARGAPVSMPIRWEELDDPRLRPDGWTMRTAEARLREVGDLFRGVLRADQDLPVS
jgi:bifunctional non-homologous end joining protein LigD